MKENEFDSLIQRYGETPVPECPGTLETNVLRRIRVAGDEAGVTMLDWAVALVARPGFVLTALALTIAVSSSMTYFSSQSRPAVDQSELAASRALGFDVFRHKDFFDLEKTDP